MVWHVSGLSRYPAILAPLPYHNLQPIHWIDIFNELYQRKTKAKLNIQQKVADYLLMPRAIGVLSDRSGSLSELLSIG